MTGGERITRWLEELPQAERDQLGCQHAAEAAAAGAQVLTPDGQTVPIPPLLSPESWSRAERDALEADAHSLLRALSRLAHHLLGGAGGARRGRLFAAFGPLEAEALATTWLDAEHLATARVDFLHDLAGRPRALEVNATIPAMQGYSDAVAASFLRVIGRARGLDPSTIEALIDENGRNTDELLAALIEHYRRLGGTAPLPTIAIVARAGDAQLGELRHYARRFEALGHPTAIYTPDQARLDSGGYLELDGRRYDLVYRHVFARRLDPASPFARACLAPARHRILNPIASHLEVKGMLGHLSDAAQPHGGALAAEIGLTDKERVAIARVLPWTRLLSHAPTRGPDGELVADLAATVAAEPARFVLKRSWDYGGRSVFLGESHDPPAAARAGEAIGVARPLDWGELVAAATDDTRDAWVVQELVGFAPRHHLVATPSGTVARSLYLDRCAFTNLGTSARPAGGAARAAPAKIVNILGGGGLAPLILDEVLAKL